MLAERKHMKRQRVVVVVVVVVPGKGIVKGEERGDIMGEKRMIHVVYTSTAVL